MLQGLHDARRINLDKSDIFVGGGGAHEPSSTARGWVCQTLALRWIHQHVQHDMGETTRILNDVEEGDRKRLER